MDTSGVVILKKKSLTFDEVVKQTSFTFDELVVMCSTLATVLGEVTKGDFTPEEFQAMIHVLKT